MNLNDQYKAAVNFNSIVSDFAAVQLAAAKLSGDADVELFLAESCEDCGNHLPTEGHSQRCIERAAERERDEADHWEAGREARLRDKELFGRGIF